MTTTSHYYLGYGLLVGGFNPSEKYYTLLMRHGAARDPASPLVRAPSRVLQHEVLPRQPHLRSDGPVG